MYFFFNDTATTEIYTLSLHDALPIFIRGYCGGAGRYVLDLVRLAAVADVSDLLHLRHRGGQAGAVRSAGGGERDRGRVRSEEHTSELQSRQYLVCRLLLEKKKS